MSAVYLVGIVQIYVDGAEKMLVGIFGMQMFSTGKCSTKSLKSKEAYYIHNHYQLWFSNDSFLIKVFHPQGPHGKRT